jgi:hypothetical protein
MCRSLEVAGVVLIVEKQNPVPISEPDHCQTDMQIGGPGSGRYGKLRRAILRFKMPCAPVASTCKTSLLVIGSTRVLGYSEVLLGRVYLHFVNLKNTV